jgi:hypothetical protein
MGKSVTVDDCSHYVQYAVKGDKMGNSYHINHCTWKWTKDLLSHLINLNSKHALSAEIM